HAGHLPFWLAPVQVVVATITEEANDYAKDLIRNLDAHDIRVLSDLRNEKISYKIREHSLAKIPVMLVIGKKEKENRTVSIREYGNPARPTLKGEEVVKVLATASRDRLLRAFVG
ncbi:His/Gly/Thr/Pro-type tRNA ligase C-terminal domain-containing protein, partial [Acetobacter malorum]